MNLLLLYGIGMGLLLFVALLWFEKKLVKAFEINPLLELGLIYLAFYWLPDLANGFLPESWKMAQIDTPFQLEGPLGFLLRLNKPQMSVVELGFSVFLACIVGRFIYVMTSKKALWGKIGDKENN
jgi:hypothetical protein